jgi:putative ABC transport system permease protein
MLASIFKNYRKNLLSVILLIIGYFIGILSLSIGISVVKDVRDYSLDSTSGNVNDMIIVDVNSSKKDNLSYKNINNILEQISHDLEVQVLNFGNIKINDNESYKSSIIPIINTKNSDWHIPITYGRYFSSSECSGSNRVVIIGKELESEIFPNGIDKNSNINIYSEEYNVIGVAGRRTRETQWDNIVYIPFKALPKILKENFSERMVGNNTRNDYSISLLVRKNQNNKINLKNVVNKSFQNHNNYGIRFDTIDSRDNSSIFNSIFITILISGMILIVVVINVVNLSLFWIFNRKNEICIKKIIGATDTELIISIILETTIIAVFSSMLAIIVHSLIFKIYNSYFVTDGISIEISIYNYIISFCVSIICGCISSIAPIKEILKMEPAEALKS